MGVSIFSPAKINLFLAVTGRRPDGYHDLVSVAAPLDFGDEIEAESREPGAGSQFTLSCNDPEVPVGDTNLVLKAAHAFAAATGWKDRVVFRLTKRIPLGAGLGGGSSNAVATLRALNRLSGGLLDESALAGLATALGSDCALFLRNAPAVMRGRGERTEVLSEAAAKRIRGRRVLLFKPGFSVSTAWAYGRMVARGSDYLRAGEAESRLSAWTQGRAPAEELLFNNMEGVAFEKFPALPVLLAGLRRESGLAPHLSGSGSACFALPGEPSAGPGPADPVTRMKHLIENCWGPAAFVQEARLV
jgi:4-diphosphocytidyl-2-C-methyl-D-erythritol kinase